MATNRVAIRIRIGLTSNGSADYPDFNQLPTIAASGMDWSHYVDREGIGWCYDVTSGHREDTPDSPAGSQFGCLLLPPAVAAEAVAAFGASPYQVSIMTPAQFEAFHDAKATVRQPGQITDDRVVARIRAKRDAGIALDQDDTNALDPDHPEPGIQKNRRKRWADRKVQSGIRVIGG